MSSLPRVNYPGHQRWVGFVISGCWFLALTVPLSVVFSLISMIGLSRHHERLKDSTTGAQRLINDGLMQAESLAAAVFLAAFVAARSRWSYKPALSALFASTVCSVIWLGPAFWKGGLQAFSGDAWMILPMLGVLMIAAFSGGWLGERHFHRQ